MSDNIQDNEFQLLGKPTAPRKRKPKRGKMLWVIASVCALVVVLALLLAFLYSTTHPAEPSVDEPIPLVFEPEPAPSSEVLDELLAPYDSVETSGCAVLSVIVNDIPLRIFYPRNAHPRLAIGSAPLTDRRNILVMQAADIRADNGKIVGAFVEAGTPRAWGLSKQGYCGILGDSVYVGVADNSPLFEQATEQGGYFFRQYPLVDNGVLQESNLKTKSVRRGLCEVGDRIVAIETETQESMHDFAQALVDMGVSNAIYLIGSSALGCAVDLEGTHYDWGQHFSPMPRYINYIYWQRD